MTLATGGSASLAKRSGEGHMLMAALLAFGVVGWEQVLHTDPGGPPVYQVLHWLSDSLLALPLALGAVVIGSWVASRRGIGRRRKVDIFVRAYMIALVFAVLLVPGGFMHEQIDNLTRSHAAISLHTHYGLVAARDSRDPAVILAFVTHAFADGVIGQVVGLPLAVLALAWIARRHSLTRSRPTNTAPTGAFNSEGMTIAP
jgi:hypothetical protein